MYRVILPLRIEECIGSSFPLELKSGCKRVILPLQIEESCKGYSLSLKRVLLVDSKSLIKVKVVDVGLEAEPL